MFGYVRPSVGELTVSDYEYYRAVYCGICRSMGEECGCTSRACLSYDSVFLALLVDCLCDSRAGTVNERCPVNPLAGRKMVRDSAGVAYASAVGGMLAAFGFRDDLADESGIRRFGARLAMTAANGWEKKAEELYPGLKAGISSAVRALSDAEAGAKSDPGRISLDTLADICGETTAFVCSYPFSSDPEKKDEAAVAAAIGKHLGRWVYFADALDDMKKDEKLGRFNPFVGVYGKSGLSDEEKKTILCLSGSEAAETLDAFELISGGREGSTPSGRIIRNILSLGIPAVTAEILDGTYRKPGKNKI